MQATTVRVAIETNTPSAIECHPSAPCPLNNKSVAFVRHNILTRGSDLMADILAKRLRDAGANVETWHARQSFKTRFPIDRRSYFPLRHRSSLGILAELSIRSWDSFDYVISDFAPLAYCIGLGSRHKLIYFAQNHDVAYYRSPLLQRIVRSLCQRIMRQWHVPVMCTSNSLAQTLATQYGAHPIVIREGEWARLLYFRNLATCEQVIKPTTRFAVMAIAGQSYAKGADILRLALEYIARALGDDVEFWIAGCPVAWSFRNARCHSLGVLSQSQMMQRYASANAFLFTSRVENFPSPPFEAMMCGAPVISTPVADYLEDQRNAVLVDAADPAKMGLATVEVLCNSNRARLLIRGGQQTVARAERLLSTLPTADVDFRQCCQARKGQSRQ